MSYLILQDFRRLIQGDNLLQVIGSDLSVLNGIELAAQATVTSYLTQKYLVAQEFTDTGVYNPSTIYKAAQRVYLDALPYSPLSAYLLGALTLQGGSVYISNISITPEPFNISHWNLLGTQYDLFFVQYPAPVFNLYANYYLGDSVWWADAVYRCALPTITLDHQTQLQLNTNQVTANVFPNDKINGRQNWGTGTPYAVPSGTLPNDWTKGDNRNTELVMYACDIALYHIHSRIAPRNMPELREKRYDDAIKWLKAAAKGDITPNLPVIQPLSGSSIRYGGNTKNINFY